MGQIALLLQVQDGKRANEQLIPHKLVAVEISLMRPKITL
jgi:hypothetical protein